MSTASRLRKKVRRNPGRAWAEQFFRDTPFQRYLKRKGQRYNDHPGIRKQMEGTYIYEELKYSAVDPASPGGDTSVETVMFRDDEGQVHVVQ